MEIYVISEVAEAMGVHVGAWFDLEGMDVYSLEDEIFRHVTMFEWRVAKVRAPFDVPTNTDISDLFAIQEYLDGPNEEAFIAYVELQNGNVQYALDYFEDAYRGEHESLEDFAHDYLMEVDENYRQAYESVRGWTPDIDIIAFHCDFDEHNGHIFSSV